MIRFGLYLVLVCLIQGCGYLNISSASTDKPIEFDSATIDSLFFDIGKKNDPAFAYKAVQKLMRNSHQFKDSLSLANFHRLIAHKYMMNSDYENAHGHLTKAKSIFLKLNRWDSTMDINKSIARVYRHTDNVHQIETFLKHNLNLIKNANIDSYAELYPIHELAVHYSYDVHKYAEAVTYGERFFSRLSHFDSLQVDNRHFNDLKENEKDVIHLILGVSYTKLGHFKKSFSHLTDALINYTKREDTEKLIRTHKALVEYYIQTANKEKLSHHKEEFFKATRRHNTLLANSGKDLNKFIIKALEDEKALQILTEENKSKSVLIYCSIAIMLLLVLFQWYGSKLRREKREVALRLEKQYEFNAFKTNLLITIAHELRTPLTIILGQLQLISDESIPKEHFQHYFDKIKSTSQGILTKMSDIIHLLKEEKSTTSVLLQEINIQSFLREAFFGFEGMARIKQIDLTFISSLSANQNVKTDSNILGRIVTNLIHNAIKFSNSNSKIKMHIDTTGDSLIIQIIDQGIGINEADQEVIFDKFKRISNRSSIDGFGIGLATVKELTAQLKGSIQVESMLGQGSTFTVTLPNTSPSFSLTKNKATYNSAIDASSFLAHTENKYLGQILIVEDNTQMCSFYKHIFTPFLNCTFAFNGEEGITMATSTSFDIILSDVMMPKMDGFEFKENVRAAPRNALTPFILVTAKNQDDSKIKAFNIGVDDYIVKPFNKDELIARIKALMANKKARERWFFSTEENLDSNTTNTDIKTVRKLHKIVLNHCDNENFGVSDLAKEIGLSQRQLVRVTRKLTGFTPVKFILEVRMLQAYKKIKNKEEADINNVRFAVGIQSASYFSTQFKKRFGLNPTELVKYRKNRLISLEETHPT